jgi:predicted dienelactone hydrolase
MSDATEKPAGSVQPASLPVIQTPGASATVFALPSNLLVQDLSYENLLKDAPRTTIEGGPVPMVGGIPLLYKLGQGGMGAVYLGFHPRLRVEVAVKILPTRDAAQYSASIQRFFREGQLAAKVKSPHLVSVLDVNEEHGLFYLVMDYIAGMSAGNYLRTLQKKGSLGLNEESALSICLAASEGLRCAHAHNVIHRDVKPDNILIPKEEESGSFLFDLSKLADLGLARTSDGDQALTNVETTLGTPGFLAPEQATDAKNAGKPADIFAMGATLYALLCGQPPFRGKTAVATILDSMQNPHQPVEQLRPDVSPPVIEIIDRCLNKKPERRYADAAELSAALQCCRPQSAQATATVPIRGAPAPTLAAQPAALTVARSVQLRPQIFAAPPPRKKLRNLALLSAPILLCCALALWYIIGSEPAGPEGQLLSAPAAPDSAQEKLKQQEADAAKRREEEEKKRLEDEAKKAHDIAEEARLKKLTDDEQAVTAGLEQQRASIWDRDNMNLRDDVNSTQAALKAARQKAQESAKALDTARQEENNAKSDANNKLQALNTANSNLAPYQNTINTCWTAWQSARNNSNHTPAANQNVKKARDALTQAQTAANPFQKARDEADKIWRPANNAYEAATTKRQQAENAANRDKTAAAAANDAVKKSMAKLQDFELLYGPYTAGTAASIVLHDDQRNSDVTLALAYPLAAGTETFPLVIVSPGMPVVKDAYGSICRYWATYGYICIQVLPPEAENASPMKILSDPQIMENYARDLTFILNSLPALKDKVPALKNLINEHAVGLCGHAPGACAAQLAAGVKSSLFENISADKRVTALLLLSSPGRDVAGFNGDSWKNLALPLLNITGTKDSGPIFPNYEMHKDPFLLSPAGNKYDLVLNGAQHNLGLAAPEVPEQRNAIKLASLNFWDAYLKKDTNAEGYLHSDALVQYAKGKLILEKK